MKRKFAALCLVAILAGVLSGCGNSAPSNGGSAGIGSPIRYSNLVDSDTQQKVGELLKTAGISSNSVELFLSMVQDYNTLVGSQPYFHDGFTDLPKDGLDYNTLDTYTLWMDRRNYADANCRITAYCLLRDSIAAASVMPADDFLSIDSDALDNYSIIGLSEKERGVFNALFNPVSVAPTTDAQVVQEAVRNEWKSRGITFPESGAAMVSVILHSELDNSAYVGHVGVLLPDGDGWLFVEKYSPTYPYQATKFQTRGQVREYLMERLGSNYTEGVSAEPFVLENDHPFSD